MWGSFLIAAKINDNVARAADGVGGRAARRDGPVGPLIGAGAPHWRDAEYIKAAGRAALTPVLTPRGTKDARVSRLRPSRPSRAAARDPSERTIRSDALRVSVRPFLSLPLDAADDEPSNALYLSVRVCSFGCGQLVGGKLVVVRVCALCSRCVIKLIETLSRGA
jgi:hypothetical protein